MCFTIMLTEHRPGCAGHWKTEKETWNTAKSQKKVVRKVSGWIRWTTSERNPEREQRDPAENPFFLFCFDFSGAAPGTSRIKPHTKLNQKGREDCCKNSASLGKKNQSKSCTRFWMGPTWLITHQGQQCCLKLFPAPAAPPQLLWDPSPFPFAPQEFPFPSFQRCPMLQDVGGQ